MQLLFETSVMGTVIRVFEDRIEYRAQGMPAAETLPLDRLARAEAGGVFSNLVTLHLIDGQRIQLRTGKKLEVIDAIRRARGATGVTGVTTSVTGATTGVTTGGVADELAKLAALRTQGVLTEREFRRQKAALLANQRGGGAWPIIRNVIATIVIVFVVLAVIGTFVGAMKASKPKPSGNAAVDRLRTEEPSDRLVALPWPACKATREHYVGMNPRTKVGYWSVHCAQGSDAQVAVHDDSHMNRLDCRAFYALTDLKCYEPIDARKVPPRSASEVEAAVARLPQDLQDTVMRDLAGTLAEFSND